MTRSRAQAGDGKVGCILWALVVALGALIAWKTIPVKIASSELYDFMVEQAKFGARLSPERVKRLIVERADDLDLPLDAKNVSVNKTYGRVRMRAYFVVPLEFPGYVYDWEFDLEVDRPIFVF